MSLKKLFKEIKKNNVEKVKEILKKGDFDLSGRMGKQTALYLACELGYLEIALEILKQPNLDVNRGYYNDTKAIAAGIGGSILGLGPVLALLVGNYTPLWAACKNNRVEIVRELLYHPEIKVEKSNPIAFTSNVEIRQMLRQHENFGGKTYESNRRLAMNSARTLKESLENMKIRMEEKERLIHKLETEEGRIEKEYVKVEYPPEFRTKSIQNPRTSSKKRRKNNLPLHHPERTGGGWISDPPDISGSLKGGFLRKVRNRISEDGDDEQSLLFRKEERKEVRVRKTIEGFELIDNEPPKSETDQQDLKEEEEEEPIKIYEEEEEDEGEVEEEEDGVRRYAYLVGQNQGELKGCVYDSQRMEERLNSFGYRCTRANNVTYPDFSTSYSQFLDRIERQNCQSQSQRKEETVPPTRVIFYYSGHGCEVGGKTYLMCFMKDHIGMNMELGEVLRGLNRLKVDNCEIVCIIDACRYSEDNRVWKSRDRTSRIMNAPQIGHFDKKFILGFSCASGRKAEGGRTEKDLSVYTGELLSSMKKGVSVMKILTDAGDRMDSLHKVMGVKPDQKQIAWVNCTAKAGVLEFCL